MGNNRLSWLLPVAAVLLLWWQPACSDSSAVGPDGDGDADGDADGDGDGDACVHPVCDLWPPCGCDRGTTCAQGAEDRGCITAGPAAHGEQCEAPTECSLGTLCAGFADEPRYCVQYCITDADCGAHGAGSLCALSIGSATGSLAVTVCTIDCDPSSLTPACTSGHHCGLFEVPEGGQLFSHCSGVAGDGTAGMPCADSADCQSGHFCANITTGELQCIRRCVVGGAGSECGVGESCIAFSEPALLGAREYGYCQG